MRQTITIAADLQELPRLAAWAEASAPGFGLSERQIYAIQLCLEEVAINLVLHAQPASPHPIQVTVSLEGSPLRLTVEDDGPAFDPTLREPARPADSVETAAIGGLGLKLMESFATSRDYARVGERNRLTLCFAGQGDAAAPAPAS